MASGRFRTLGLRFRSFGRTRLEHYGVEPDTMPARSEAAAWIARAELPAPSSPMASPLPQAWQDAIQPSSPAFSATPPPSTAEPAQVQGGIPVDLLRILELHLDQSNERSTEAAQRTAQQPTTQSGQTPARPSPAVRSAPGTPPPVRRRAAGMIEEITPAQRAAREGAARIADTNDSGMEPPTDEETFDDDVPGGVPTLDELPLNWQVRDADTPQSAPAQRYSAPPSEIARDSTPAPANEIERPTTTDAVMPSAETQPVSAVPPLLNRAVSGPATVQRESVPPAPANTRTPLPSAAPRAESESPVDAVDLDQTQLTGTPSPIRELIDQPTPEASLPQGEAVQTKPAQPNPTPSVNHAFIPSETTDRPVVSPLRVDVQSEPPSPVQRQVSSIATNETPIEAMPPTTRLSSTASSDAAEPNAQVQDVEAMAEVYSLPISDGDDLPEIARSFNMPTAQDNVSASSTFISPASLSELPRDVSAPSTFVSPAASSELPQSASVSTPPSQVEPGAVGITPAPAAIAHSEAVETAASKAIESQLGSVPALTRAETSLPYPVDNALKENAVRQQPPEITRTEASVTPSEPTQTDFVSASLESPQPAPMQSPTVARAAVRSESEAEPLVRSSETITEYTPPTTADTTDSDHTVLSGVPSIPPSETQALRPGQSAQADSSTVARQVFSEPDIDSIPEAPRPPASPSPVINASSESFGEPALDETYIPPEVPAQPEAPPTVDTSSTPPGKPVINRMPISEQPAPSVDRNGTHALMRDTDVVPDPVDDDKPDIYEAMLAAGMIQPPPPANTPAPPNMQWMPHASLLASQGNGVDRHSSTSDIYSSAMNGGRSNTEQPGSINNLLQRKEQSEIPVQMSREAAPASAPARAEGESPEASEDEGTEDQKLERLARDVYRLLRNRLRIEQERRVDK